MGRQGSEGGIFFKLIGRLVAPARLLHSEPAPAAHRLVITALSGLV